MKYQLILFKVKPMQKVLSFWAVTGMALTLLKEQNSDHQVSAAYQKNEEVPQMEETTPFAGSMTRNTEDVQGNRISKLAKNLQ